MGIVDGLETVQVEKGDRQRVVLAVATQHRLLQAVPQQHAVGQTGQGVEMGNVFELLLMRLVGGDVGEQRHVMLGLAVLVAHGADGQDLGIQLTVLVPVPDFATPLACAQQRGPHGAVELRPLPPGTQDTGCLADRFLAAEPGDAGERIVDLHDVAPGIGDDDAFHGVREHACRQLERLFGPLALGDVGHGAHQALRHAICSALRHHATLQHPPVTAVLAALAVFADIGRYLPVVVRHQCCQYPGPVLRMQALLPSRHLGIRRVGGKAQQLLVQRRIPASAAQRVPVPHTVARAFERKLPQGLAGSAGLDGLHVVGHVGVGAHPGAVAQWQGADLKRAPVGGAAGIGRWHLHLPVATSTDIVLRGFWYQRKRLTEIAALGLEAGDLRVAGLLQMGRQLE